METTPVILEVAINGVTSKTKNPNAPRTPAEIEREALRAFALAPASFTRTTATSR